jgi:hypothetical protein
METDEIKTGPGAPSREPEVGQGSREPGESVDQEAALMVLRSSGSRHDVALRNAVRLWAESNTDSTSDHQADLIQSKISAVLSFFRFSERELGEITPLDVRSWRESLETQGLKPATVYARISRLSSFFDWLIRNPALSSYIKSALSLLSPSRITSYGLL